MKSLSTVATMIVLSAACVGADAEPTEPTASAVPAMFETTPPLTSDPKTMPGGDLRVVNDDVATQSFPLEHTHVRADIVGNVVRVEVTQSFRNPYDKKIEAVYVFPLPNRAAVDDMTILVGERTVRGVIKKRDEARRIYESARRAGHVAALLDQERPNIFTQSVANILPGNNVEVTIRYFEALPYRASAYEFSFPMVVGPRFIPGAPTSSGARGWASDTTDVPDASRITPPVLEPGRRSGHDISLMITLDAGTGIEELVSPSHRVEIQKRGSQQALVELAQEDSIPNKDFVLRYEIDGDAPELVLLPHRAGEDGYFLALIQPEAQPADDAITPKEMIFVVDGSGSMSGFPIEKVKEAMRHALSNLNLRDTFQIVRFSNGAETLAPHPLPATRKNIQQGLAYVEALSGRGGTIMLEGVKAALDYPEDPERLRIVSFMTDGYIGNENQILAYLEKHLGRTRLFPFGVGSSVNRFLLDKMAEFGRGAVEYVLLEDDAEVPVNRFYERIRNPYLTDIEIDWGELAVTDVYPRRIPDLFLGQPVVLHGRYTGAATGTVSLKARLGGRAYRQKLTVELPDRREEGEAIGTLWARARIEDLANREIVDPRPELAEEITEIALAHRLVSAYTSFVAVEERLVTGSDQPVLVEVPVEMPEGVSYEGVFGNEQVASASGGYSHGKLRASILPAPAAPEPRLAERMESPSLPGASEDRAVANGEREPRFEADGVAYQDERPGLGVTCRIQTPRTSYRLGEAIEILVAFENHTGRVIEVPGTLSASDGSARFQVLDTEWNTLPHPTPNAVSARSVRLESGASVTLRLVLNGPNGYRLVEPGTYHVVLLGSSLGLVDSNTLTLRIER